MKKLNLFWNSLFLSALLTASAPFSAGAMPIVMVSNADGLRPVAIYQNNTFKEAPRKAKEQQAMGKYLLDKTREIPLYKNGEIQNYFRPTDFLATPESCTGSGLWRGAIEKKIFKPLLGLSPDFPGTKRYMGNYPRASLSKVADKFARNAFLAKGIKRSALKRFRVKERYPFTLQNGTRYFIAIEAEIRNASQRPCPDANVLLILEKVGRYYRQRLIKHRSNTDACGAFRFVSSFATHKTSNHILIQGLVAGARWYDIYQWQNSTFKQRFHGGGHVCKTAQR